MNTIIRNVIAVIAGFTIGSIVNMTLVTVGPTLIPPPPGVDVTNTESLAMSAHLLEPRHFLMPFLAHALGTLVGALAAFLIAGSAKARLAYALGVLFLAGGIAASFLIPAPDWFIAVDLALAYIPMAWLGIAIGKRLGRGSAGAA